MIHLSMRIGVSLGLTGLCACGGVRTHVRAAPPGEREVAAEALLRRMSETLAGSETLAVEVIRVTDAALVEGSDRAEEIHVSVLVDRPDRLRATSRGADLRQTLIFDGQRVVLHDELRELYAVAEVEGDLDAMADVLDRRFGFTPPLLEFVSEAPLQRVHAHVNGVRLVGVETIAGETCDRLAFSGELANGDLWVSRDTALPCRLAASFRGVSGAPGLRIDFVRWELGAPAPVERFTFVPPPDAQRIRMVTLEELEAADVAAVGSGGVEGTP